MNNIWELLLQSLSVSITAAVILFVKKIFADKLSPRWQYSVWIILALRILIPANVTNYIIQPVPMWTEVIKGSVEKNLSSAYSSVYEIMHSDSVFPVIYAWPSSITDILFVVYAIGIVFVLFRYLVSYARIRKALKKSGRPATEYEDTIKRICERYSLKKCRAVVVDGLSTEFVVGAINPVLALPADRYVDEKVIIHELMHLRHKDIIFGVFWSLLKALHWMNPFVLYVFGYISNDMESLCDQRVLEILEGEERRHYGEILLSMVNDRYPSVVGTGCVSNGGKNISRRISAIVRFKKYPRGMAVASVCIVVVLMSSLLMGTAKTYSLGDYRVNINEISHAMAMARVNRCTTVAGAIDTYAKGLIEENGVMIACASSVSEHSSIEEIMRGNNGYHYDSGDELIYLSQEYGYKVYNLEAVGEDAYNAVIMFYTHGFCDEQTGMLKDENDNYYTHGCVSVPVSVTKDNGWVVKENGIRKISTDSLDYYMPSEDFLESRTQINRQTPYGTVSIRVYTDHGIKNDVQTNDFWATSYFDVTPKTSARFSYANVSEVCTYDINSSSSEFCPEKSVGVQMLALDSKDDVAEFSEDVMIVNSAGSSSSGESWACESIHEGWNGIISLGGGGWSDKDNSGEVNIAQAYKVRIYWDNKLMQELLLTEEADGQN